MESGGGESQAEANFRKYLRDKAPYLGRPSRSAKELLNRLLFFAIPYIDYAPGTYTDEDGQERPNKAPTLKADSPDELKELLDAINCFVGGIIAPGASLPSISFHWDEKDLTRSKIQLEGTFSDPLQDRSAHSNNNNPSQTRSIHINERYTLGTCDEMQENNSVFDRREWEFLFSAKESVGIQRIKNIVDDKEPVTKELLLKALFLVYSSIGCRRPEIPDEQDKQNKLDKQDEQNKQGESSLFQYIRKLTSSFVDQATIMLRNQGLPQFYLAADLEYCMVLAMLCGGAEAYPESYSETFMQLLKDISLDDYKSELRSTVDERLTNSKNTDPSGENVDPNIAKSIKKYIEKYIEKEGVTGLTDEVIIKSIERYLANQGIRLNKPGSNTTLRYAISVAYVTVRDSFLGQIADGIVDRLEPKIDSISTAQDADAPLHLLLTDAGRLYLTPPIANRTRKPPEEKECTPLASLNGLSVEEALKKYPILDLKYSEYQDSGLSEEKLSPENLCWLKREKLFYPLQQMVNDRLKAKKINVQCGKTRAAGLCKLLRAKKQNK